MKKLMVLVMLVVGGLYVSGCEAPTVSADAVTCSKTGGCS